MEGVGIWTVTPKVDLKMVSFYCMIEILLHHIHTTIYGILVIHSPPCVRVVVTVEKIEEERMVGGKLSHYVALSCETKRSCSEEVVTAS